MIYKKYVFPDLTITILTVLLLSLGILVIYTSSPQLAIIQAVVAGFGLIFFFIISSIDWEVLDQYLWIIYFLTLVLLIIVFIMGVETRGSVRWISFGSFNLQPSEFAKIALILILAKFWTNNIPTLMNIFKSIILATPFLILVFNQPDLGTTIILGVIWITSLVAANASVKKILTVILGSTIIIPIIWHFLKDYQKLRLLGFLYPEKDPLGVGYNVIQSTIAVGSGEILGMGLGRGTQSRLQFLPEFRTDFIFASIAEELGFLGSAVVLSLYCLIFIKGFKILQRGDSRFSNLVVTGVLGMLFSQIMINIGMNIGIMPITGITLPLLSYGGSSILVTLVCLGLVSSVGRFHQKDALIDT